jgi:hypothetical protein
MVVILVWRLDTIISWQAYNDTVLIMYGLQPRLRAGDETPELKDKQASKAAAIAGIT